MTGKSIVQIRLTARDACMFDSGLSADARLVYYALDFHARWKGESFPAQATLASELGISLRRVERAVRKLRTGEYVSVDRHRREAATYRMAWAANQEPPQMADQEFKNRQNENQEPPKATFSGARILINEAGIETGLSDELRSENQNPKPREAPPVCPERCLSCRGTGQIFIPAIGWATCTPCRGSGTPRTVSFGAKAS